MSVYLTSDLHGDYNKFIELLGIIKFNPKIDKMFILGDILDRGYRNLSLLSLIRENIKNGSMELLKGNHELFAQMYLDGLLDAKKWITWGGKQTLIEIEQLNNEEKKELRDFLFSLEYYKILQFNGKEWLLTHSGLDADCIVETEQKVDSIASIMKAVANNEFNYLVSNDLHYMPAGKIKKLDYFMVVGHTPVINLNEDKSCKILHRKNYMCIDTGAGYRELGGKMSCYRVDDEKEFYI